MTEREEQVAFVAEVLYRYSNRPDFIRPLFFSTMNGAWLAGNPATRARLMNSAKQGGFLPGIADILYLQPRGQFHYLALEMKSKKGGVVSEKQHEFLDAVSAAGGDAWVCFGADEAMLKFNEYMAMEAHP